MKKIDDIIVYEDRSYFSAFPSAVCLPDGELIVAFRRAPNRKRFGASSNSHIDPNSQLVLVRSRDHGATWSPAPELLHAHPLGGSQDPCLTLLADGSLIASSYLWAPVGKDLTETAYPGSRGRVGHPDAVLGVNSLFLGGYLLRSTDRGRTWTDLPRPPATNTFPVTGYQPLTVGSFNRGNILEGSDRQLYWAVRSAVRGTGVTLLVSADRGASWRAAAELVPHYDVHANETCLVETAGGDLVAFCRTTDFGDHGIVIRSHDRGQTWDPWEDSGIVGHPYHALRLPDGRVFLVYGHRHVPYGVRARLLDPECRRLDAPELVLRTDGGSWDLGYPWSCLAADGTLLAFYYFNRDDGTPDQGTRHIAASRLAL